MSRREWIEVAELLDDTYCTITLDNPALAPPPAAVDRGCQLGAIDDIGFDVHG
ncbi:hypothetical protein OK015_17460 [Mycobacterium sp. Aquia_216]|uniref:hypothetical protein n=1 Tax=Mycobacterium sp. Aquia_216 TaxID=2991729 RepID=UPI00227C29D7|nr:hypothetical protein [Mycobacterium sp. Aquia_216]WAJ43026.1 hypothetical protein OK015_17460 [Mycobacterium sp. Aquia_216]